VNSPGVLVDFHVRFAQPSDQATLSGLREALWPESSAEEHSRELASILAGDAPGALPLVILVAEASDGSLAGFLELGLRSHAEGCNPSRPVGYVEGWYVAGEHRQRGVGKELSQRVHERLGFAVMERAVHFRKSLQRGES